MNDKKQHDSYSDRIATRNATMASAATGGGGKQAEGLPQPTQPSAVNPTSEAGQKVRKP